MYLFCDILAYRGKKEILSSELFLLPIFAVYEPVVKDTDRYPLINKDIARKILIMIEEALK